MPTRKNQKMPIRSKHIKTQPNRGFGFEKESWYAAAAARFSVARRNLSKGGASPR